jgi:hypothetical protein
MGMLKAICKGGPEMPTVRIGESVGETTLIVVAGGALSTIAADR